MKTSYTDEELLKLRNVILTFMNLKELQRVAQLLWTNHYDDPWTEQQLIDLETSFRYRYDQDEPWAILIRSTGRCEHGKFGFFKKMYVLEDSQVIQINPNNNMKERNIAVSIEEAREWYNGSDRTLQTLALKAYKKEELERSFELILKSVDYRTFECELSIFMSKRIEVLSKLAIIAEYYNGDWKMKLGKTAYFLGRSSAYNPGNTHVNKTYNISVLKHETVLYAGIVYFKREEDAVAAYDILGDELLILFK